MDEKILHSINELASKLGVTAEYIWGILLRQAPISAINNFIIMASFVIATILAIRYTIRKITPPDATKENPHPYAEWNDETSVFALAEVALLVGVSALVILYLFPSFVSALVNPEYWALKQILK